VEITGEFRLYRAAITDLETDTNPPSPWVATGWEVTDITGPLRSDWKAARRWLKTTAETTPDETSVQPWHALANVYERNGEPARARRLRLAAANKVTRQSPWPTKIVRSLYGLVVGYGYLPVLAGLWIAAVVGVSIIIVDWKHADFVSNPADSAAIAYLEQTHKPIPPDKFHAVSYTLSELFPTAVGNEASKWSVRADKPWLSVVLNALKLTAWVLTALLLAGVTGLLRKE
jgi:hypothetical protein